MLNTELRNSRYTVYRADKILFQILKINNYSNSEYTYNERETVYQEYWALTDSDRQKTHLCSLVTESIVERKRNTKSNTSKSRTFRFFLM